jgi:hypothetical protein
MLRCFLVDIWGVLRIWFENLNFLWPLLVIFVTEMFEWLLWGGWRTNWWILVRIETEFWIFQDLQYWSWSILCLNQNVIICNLNRSKYRSLVGWQSGFGQKAGHFPISVVKMQDTPKFKAFYKKRVWKRRDSSPKKCADEQLSHWSFKLWVEYNILMESHAIKIEKN